MQNNMRIFLALYFFMLLTACGEVDFEEFLPQPSNPDKALEEFEKQKVIWEACDPAFFEEGALELIAPIGDRLECAVLKAPLDWENPERDAINLAISRVRAANETQRKGAIVLNPGGPGEDGLTLSALFGLIFANGGLGEVGFPAASPELLRKISEEYDIVGFSPRGVGGSFQLFCGNNSTVPPANHFTDRSEENIQRLLTQGRLITEACKNTPLSSFVTTEQTVQDMDLIRRLLGDEKLNYLGYSYGSWLGAWYAKRFPENSGNIVLDANTNFDATFQDISSLQPLGLQRGFEDVAAAYLARNNTIFDLGKTSAEVYDVYTSFQDDLKAALVNAIGGNLYRSQNVPFIGQILIVGRGINNVLEEFETPLDPESYEAFVEQVAGYPYILEGEAKAELSELAVDLALTYINILESQPSPATLLPSEAVFTSITCNDSVWNQNPMFYAELGNQQNRTYPFYGGQLTFQPCAFWGEPNAAMPDIPDNLPSVLLIQSGYDVATPAEGALKAFESLPGAKLVYIENELSHTIFPYNTECVDAKVANFLLNGSLPVEDISNCDALPLPGETEVFAPETAPISDNRIATQATVGTAQSAGENEVYNLVHEILRENAASFFGH